MIDEKKFDFYEPDSSLWTWENFYNRTYRNMDYWKKLEKETKKEASGIKVGSMPDL
jgi:hypothetical protein